MLVESRWASPISSLWSRAMPSDRAEEFADTICGEIIKGVSQRIVIEILRLNGSIQKAFDRLAREELRREIQRRLVNPRPLRMRATTARPGLTTRAS